MRIYKCKLCNTISSFDKSVGFPTCPKCLFPFGYNIDSDICQIPVDWQKVRRRLEDRLRKDEEAVQKCADLLKINLT